MSRKKVILIILMVSIIFLIIILSVKTSYYEFTFFIENERTIDVSFYTGGLNSLWIYDREIECNYKIEDIEFVYGFVKFGENVIVLEKDGIKISARIEGFGNGVENTEIQHIMFDCQINEIEINNIINNYNKKNMNVNIYIKYNIVFENGLFTNELDRNYKYKMKRESVLQSIFLSIFYWIF